MCTFDRTVDTQVSAYIHKEGYWSGSKKEIFERILPDIRNEKPEDGRTLTIDVCV
jgi:hypothetical protein